ncbi:MAG: hypothetical protein ABIL09_13110 [Gemmatimonadota bacterium]
MTGQAKPWRVYLAIAAACAVLAVVAHFLFGAPEQLRRLAEQRLESAVREAVRTEARRATSAGAVPP